MPSVLLPVRAAGRSALGAAVLLGLAACGGGEGDAAAPASSETASSSAASGDGLSVVATTTVLADVARNVLGDAGTVESVMPPGADPHSFAPSASQVEQMLSADLVVENGGDLEESMLDALDEVRSADVPVVTALDSVETITFAEGGGHGEGGHGEGGHGEEGHSEHGEGHSEHGEEEHSDGEHSEEGGEHEHAAGSTDPHFWLDPARMAVVAQDMGEQLAEATGETSLVDAGEAYAEQLRELDASVQETLSAVPEDRRVLVTNHEAFGYFADRYGFEVAGTVIPALTTDAEPSAQDLEGLVETVEDEGVPAVFAENTQPQRLAQAVAGEVGSDVEVVELFSDSLGTEGSEGATYEDMMTTNAERIADALSA